VNLDTSSNLLWEVEPSGRPATMVSNSPAITIPAKNKGYEANICTKSEIKDIEITGKIIEGGNITHTIRSITIRRI
jgi:hypothetical protein